MTGAPAEFDVIVIGGGIAGLVAAVGAAEAGLAVLVLERSPEKEYICSSRLTGGVFHCALNAPDTDPATLEKVIVEGRGQGGDPSLARAVSRDVMPAIRWLQGQGARFIRPSPDPWQRFVLAPPSLGRTGEGWRRRGGDTLLRLLAGRLEASGCELRRGQRARRLIVDEAGEIQGIAGDGFELSARAVVIADGGFQQNAELVGEAISPAPAALVQRNGGTGWGDGLLMAVAAGGAASSDQKGFYGHVVSRDALEREELRFYPWLDELARHGLAVTSSGKRFCDEGKGGIHLANQIAALPDPASATVLWDEDIWRGPGRARFMAANPALEKRGAPIFRAATIAELAVKAGLDAAGLIAEVDAHNRAVAAGRGDGLVPPRSFGAGAPMAIRTPPFAAAPAAAGLTYTMGGIAVDDRARVVRRGGGHFANLFAIGGASGGLEGGEKPVYVGGLVKASATGWRAARELIALLPNQSGMGNGPTKDQ